MANQTTETIAHFIGYLHLSELLNLGAVHFEGAPVYRPQGLPGDANPLPWGLEVELPAKAAEARIIEPVHVPIEAPIVTARPLQLLQVRPPPPPATPDTLSFEPPQPLVLPAGVGIATPLPEIKVTYALGGREDHWIDVTQRNAIYDNDIVQDANIIGSPHLLPLDVYSLLSAMVAEATGLLPSFMPFALPAGVAQQHLRLSIDIEIGVSGSGTGGKGTVVAANGTYIDGVRVAESGESAQDQLQTLRAIAASIQDEGSHGDPRAAAHAPPSKNDGGVDPAQHFHAGGNEQANVATVLDLVEAFGSRIIRGDYAETSSIVQINMLRDSDVAAVSGDAIDRFMAGGNRLRNEASFIDEAGPVSGIVPTRGFNGITSWEVDYVHGHFVDVSTVVQRNFMVDLDEGAVEQTQSYHVVTFGENDQLNVSSLLELGKQYDLTIIAGDYFKFNSILQLNIVLDDDIIRQIADPNARQSGSSGGNVLENDAAIVNIGGETYHPLNANVTALADAIAARSPIIDPFVTLGLPAGFDDGQIDVLFVAGNFYNVNMVWQSNIIADMDDLQQDGRTGGALSQLVEAGANTATNGALIFDLDSQSNYQFLGGEAYEETLLVQANIIVDDDEIREAVDDRNSPSRLTDDAVAVIASLSGDDEADEGHVSIRLIPTGDADLLGGMLH